MMSTVATPHARAAPPERAAPRDQAWRLRALVEAMSGCAAEPADPPAARRVPVVAIASGKGGVGKTNLAVNLCIALSGQGRRAALLDADLGMANADVLCGLTPSRRLDDVLRDGSCGAGGAALGSCIVDAPGGFLLVPGAVGAARVAELDAPARRRLVGQLETVEWRSDLVVIDTGAGIGPDVLSFAGAADWLVVVATPEPTSVTDAYGLIKCLTARAARLGHAVPRLALAVNQVRGTAEAISVSRKLTSCCEKFLGRRPVVLGGVRADPRVGRAVRDRYPHLLSHPRARASRDIRAMAGELAGLIGLR